MSLLTGPRRAVPRACCTSASGSAGSAPEPPGDLFLISACRAYLRNVELSELVSGGGPFAPDGSWAALPELAPASGSLP